MKQKFTILFDLDGTLVDTAPDLMLAHNHVMKKFGYPTKSIDDMRNLVGKGAGALIGRSIWGQAKKEFSKVLDEKIKDEMVKEFVNFYGKNIVNESTLLTGVKDFLIWCKEQNISMAVCTNKQEHLSNDLLKKIGISADLAALASVSLSPIIIVFFTSPSNISTTFVRCLGSGLQ